LVRHVQGCVEIQSQVEDRLRVCSTANFDIFKIHDSRYKHGTYHLVSVQQRIDSFTNSNGTGVIGVTDNTTVCSTGSVLAPGRLVHLLNYNFTTTSTSTCTVT
jgi:hypothetical protein